MGTKEKVDSLVFQLGFIEKWAAEHGFPYVIGIDEAGRGCLAGPVAASAVFLPSGFDVSGLNDSKQLSLSKRVEMAERVRRSAVFALRYCDNKCIDEIGILPATFRAMKASVMAVVETLNRPINQILVAVDGKLEIPGLQLLQKAWIKADSRSFSVAAASNIAKTNRDMFMDWVDGVYPDYGFRQHKGYGTKQHMQALRKNGPCPLHRRSFKMPEKLLK